MRTPTPGREPTTPPRVEPAPLDTGEAELRPWWGEFVSSEVETSYLMHANQRLRHAAFGLLALMAVAFVGFGVMLDLTRGVEGPIPGWVLWFRIAWLAVGVAMFEVARRFQTPRVAQWVLLATACSVVAWFSVVAYQYGLVFDSTDRRTYFLVMTPMAMLFAPWSLRYAWATVGVELMAVIGLELALGTSPGDIGRALVLLVTVAMIAHLVGARLQRARRHEYLYMRQAEVHRAQLAESNAALASQLQHVQKMDLVGQLASGVAHDFNNVLQAIYGYVELARLDIPPDSPVGEDIDGIGESADRGAQLVRQLLAMGRRHTTEKRATSLDEVARSLSTMLRRLLPRNIELAIDGSRDMPRIYADVGQLEQIIMNLVVNARDAMPDGGVIKLEVELEREDEEDPGEVVLRVSDTGMGMDAATRARIFEAFFTTKEEGRGTGLGLATVKHIVDEHRGRIEVHSEPGRGTCFELRFPAVFGAATSELVTSEIEIPKGRGETILIVEDEPRIAAILARRLGHEGYDVLRASDGMQGMTAVESFGDRISAVVTDVDMPAASGVELYEAIREWSRDLPVLVTTAFPSRDVTAMIKADPRADLVVKPYRAARILKRLRTLIDGPVDSDEGVSRSSVFNLTQVVGERTAPAKRRASS